jgi:hypothetical protein
LKWLPFFSSKNRHTFLCYGPRTVSEKDRRISSGTLPFIAKLKSKTNLLRYN